MASIYQSRPWLKHYPASVPPDLEIGEDTVLSDFLSSVARRPDAPAVLYFDHTIGWSEMDRLSSCFASALAELGVARGDRIVLLLQNVPQFLIGTYGAWKAGAVVVPLNPMFKEKELRYFCRDSGARVLLTLEEIAAGLDRSFLDGTSVAQVITTSPLDFLPEGAPRPAMLEKTRRARVPGCRDLLELLRRHEGRAVADPGLSPAEVAFLTYTSGTTGPPKGAMNTHGNIAFNARVYGAMQRLDEHDVVLGVAPLFHVTGEVAHLAVAALTGIPLILYYRFDAGETLRLIERWNATMTVASITVYLALMNHPDIRQRDLSSFTKAYSGGAPVSEAAVQRFEELTGLYLYNVYGMTETNSPSHMVPWGRRAPVDPQSGALSVGLPVPNCVVRIVDLEEGTRELAAGEVGEILDSGPIVIPGYWQKPEETRNAIRKGWLYTGDVGKMDAEGWFYVVDRKKDMIIASGYKVWPRDVEDVIYQHPAVKEASVVGMPDPYRGETVKAFVALRDDWQEPLRPEEIIAFCKARMAAYKYPREVEIVPEIPKTLTGKFLRRVLREKAGEGG